MKKRMISIALALVMTIGLTACGQRTSENKGPSEPEARIEAVSGASEQTKTDTGTDLSEIKLVLPTQSSGDVNYVKAMHAIADEISEKTNGKFIMETRENGSLMIQEGEVDTVAGGSPDVMLSLPLLIFDQLPYLTTFTAAYIFQNEQHMRTVMDGKIGQKVADDMAKKLNVRWLSALYYGTRHLDMRDVGKEITKPEDLNGVNLRTPSSSAWLFMGRVSDVNPTPMAYAEIYQGLQTGAIDGQENPSLTIIVQKRYEVISQIVLTGHVIEPICIAINEQKWQVLPQGYRDIMTEAVEAATVWCDEASLKQKQEAITFLKEQGLTVTEPDLDAFMKYSENHYLNDKDMIKDWDMDLHHQIKDLEYQ